METKLEIRKEHEWLQQLVGEWAITGEWQAAPGQPPQQWQSTETVRPIGRAWIQSEGRSTMPDGDPHLSCMTLGFNGRTQRFVGSWIGSMMDHQWVYEGELDAAGRVLTLNCEGPSFTGEGLAKYQDIIEIKGPDERLLHSQFQGPDGQWTRFMTSTYRRKG